ETERPRVLAERRDVLVGVRSKIHPRLLRADDRTVVDVGEVHHLLHPVAEQVLQRSAENVHADEGAKVADVPARIHGGAAGIHADGVVEARRERFFGACESVVQTHRHAAEPRGPEAAGPWDPPQGRGPAFILSVTGGWPRTG